MMRVVGVVVYLVVVQQILSQSLDKSSPLEQECQQNRQEEEKKELIGVDQLGSLLQYLFHVASCCTQQE